MGLGVWGLFGLLALSPPARAAGACDALDLPNKIFGAGGSAITPTLRAIAVALANDASGDPADRTTVLYADPGGCDGYADLVAGSTVRTFKYWVAGGNAAATDKICEARSGGQPLDFAYLEHHRADCSESPLADGVTETAAPVESLSLVTGIDSVEMAISAEALYLLFGLGSEAEVSPWSDGTGVFPRAGNSWETRLLSLAIDVPAEAFKWAQYAGAASPIGAVEVYSASPTLAAQALSYVRTPTADNARARVKALAYQHYGQACGVYPDATANSLDKLNVRAGKYALWTNGYFYARDDDERVANFIGWFNGESNPAGSDVDALELIAHAGNVPQCAMQTRRSSTFGAPESFAPPKPCGCFFEHTTGGGSCEACADDSECGGDAPRCNFGFCEAYRAEDATEG